MKFFYIILGLAIFLSLATWQFWPSSIQNQQQLKIQEDSHHHEDEHGHLEQNIVKLTSDQIKDFGIQTSIVSSGELSETISTRGKIVLHPDKLIHILTKISGVAKEAFKNIGDPVKAGDVLAVLESREIADIKADFLAAKERKNLSESLMEREKILHEKKISAEQDYINAKSANVEATINFQLAKQKLHAFGMDESEILKLSTEEEPDLRLYFIRSPMDGVVIARHINKGEFIENTTTIYEIADLSTVWIEIGIYPKDLPKVKTGQMVDISLPLDKKQAEAKIIYLSPIIQDDNITAKAIAELKTPSENFRPGSFVKVNIATENVVVPLLISRDAIQEMDEKEFVFIKIPEGFEKRQIKIGVGNHDFVEVLSGLSLGEEYASSNTFLLKADLSKGEAEHEHS